MLDPTFFSYVTVMSITPGPNNLLLATSGVNFGFRRTLPMMFGILLGCALQLLFASVALDVLLSGMASMRLPLTVVGCSYLLWLSWKIFRADAPQRRERPRPMTLLGGIAFQAVNPKAWLMVTNVALMYVNSSGVIAVLVGYALLNLPCILLWAALGDRLRTHLLVAWKRQAFNTLMALSLVATTGWMLFEAVQFS